LLDALRDDRFEAKVLKLAAKALRIQLSDELGLFSSVM
jgi:hypothetical protein